MGALPWLAWHRLNFFLKWQHTLLGWLDEVVTSTMSFNKHLMFLFPPSQGRALEVLSLGPCAPAGVWCGLFLSSTPRVRQLGIGTAVRSPVWTSGFLHLLIEAAPRNGQGWGRGLSLRLQCQGKGLDLPALGRLWMCVCQLPVCLLELCKQLWLHALETLPNDRLNPQGKQASAVKDYINVLRSPSTTLWISWSFSCLNRKIASGQNREAPERPLLGSPRRGFPILSCGRSSLPRSQLGGSAFWVHSLCWRVDRVPEEASTPAPSGRPGRQGYSQPGCAPQQWGLSTWQPGLTWDLDSFGMWAEERKGCRIHMA